jgi:prolyl-tRNA editing enzyme YbaK/EbsC (Cys-tRNA(Pro) deacylase)
MMNTVFEKLIQFLRNSKITFRHIQHSPTYTCEESAKARNEPIEIGAKAMVMRLDDVYALFVLSAAMKLDSKKIKALLPCRSMRFASPEELFELTALVPGSVPPFGIPILPFKLYVDLSIQHLPQIAFNAGSLSDSVILATQDYLNVCEGHLCSFSK